MKAIKDHKTPRFKGIKFKDLARGECFYWASWTQCSTPAPFIVGTIQNPNAEGLPWEGGLNPRITHGKRVAVSLITGVAYEVEAEKEVFRVEAEVKISEVEFEVESEEEPE